jgi:hypothetical protein
MFLKGNLPLWGITNDKFKVIDKFTTQFLIIFKGNCNKYTSISAVNMCAYVQDLKVFQMIERNKDGKLCNLNILVIKLK